MVSAISLCFLALGLSATSSQLVSSEVESLDTPISDRRTFKHGKPIKLLPLLKKHKKFGGYVPHIFSKTSYAEIPVIHEAPKPLYKVHRYQGIEVKPVPELSFSTTEPIIETHSVEPGDFVQTYSSDHPYSAPAQSSSVVLYPINEKPLFSAPVFSSHSPGPIPASFSLPPPKPILSFVPAPPPQPVFSSIPITTIPPASPFPSITISRPAPNLTPALPPQVPVFTPIPVSPPPPQPVFSSFPIKLLPSLPALSSVLSSAPIKIQAPILPSPTPSPANVFSPVSVKIPAPVLPSLPSPVSVKIPAPVLPSFPSPVSVKIPAPVLPSFPSPVSVKIPAPVLPSFPSPVSVKIPAPVLPSLPAPSPAPIFSSISAVSSTPVPAVPPAPFSVIPSPSPSPSLPAFPPPAPALPSFSISPTPEPEFPYAPSGTPIPSYIKDISLGEIELKDTPLPTIETPKYEEVTSTINDDGSKNLEHVLGTIKNENGLFQKIKGWKADKANAALNHFIQFKQKPLIPSSFSISHPPNKVPVAIPTPQVTVYPTLQIPGPTHPLPLAPAPIFFPPAQFFPPAKYENFPPNNIESPPLFNSYGVPIPHDSYAPVQASHERLSSDASEDEPAVVPAPSQENLETQQQPTQIRQKFQSQNFEPEFQPQAIPNDHPIYVPENNKTVREDNKEIDDIQPEADDYKKQKEPNSEVNNYPNHKE